jgi:hypothetical protein
MRPSLKCMRIQGDIRRRIDSKEPDTQGVKKALRVVVIDRSLPARVKSRENAL